MRSATRPHRDVQRRRRSIGITHRSSSRVRLRFGIVTGFVIFIVFVGFTPRPSVAISHGQMADSGTIGEPNVDLAVAPGAASESTGAAVLSIPVDLPPGTNGFEPSVELTYSTDRGNGDLGVGWSIETPVITCSTRFGVPDYANCPRYELSGELLVGPDGAGSYHTLVESFQRIERSSTALRPWTVLSPDGSSRRFGESRSAQVQGPGGTAEWYLSSITDVFGNRISYTWSRGARGDKGVRYLNAISYAGNTRVVRFIYEGGRPDPTYGFAGGIERIRKNRLREIRVLVNGAVHHRLVLGYETAIDTTQSRLVSVQRFGTDCDPGAFPVPRPGDCSSLPAATFEYTDQGAVARDARWEPQGTLDEYGGSPPWFPPTSSFGSGGFMAAGENMQVADVNGDGLPDLIADHPAAEWESYPNDPPVLAGVIDGLSFSYQASPQVFLNDGSTGFERPEWSSISNTGHASGPLNESAVWTERLATLRFDLPRHRVRQVENTGEYRPGFSSVGIPLLGTCVLSGESVPRSELLVDRGSVQFAPPVQRGKPPYFDSTSQRAHHSTDWQPNFPYPQPAAWDDPVHSEIRPWPQFYFADLNADGLADMVMSVYLSGYHLSLGDCESPSPVDPSPATWVEGEQTRIVFINNGAGWDLDDGRDPSDGVIADSLPDFGLIAFESADMVIREVLKDPTYAWLDEGEASPCLYLGLGGNREFHPDADINSWDFCIGTFDLAPTFQDLNGDGYPDLIVTQSADRDALLQNDYWKIGTSLATAFRETKDPVSVAYIQNPEASGVGTDTRWVRAPAYDPPYAHAEVVQFDGDTPGATVVPNPSAGTWGQPNAQNVDKGVRFADLNRDGLPDMIFSPGGALVDEFGRAGGVFLNRGFAGDYTATTARHDAWCSSSPVEGVALCAEQASRYESPERYADFSEVAFNEGGGNGSVGVIAPLRNIHFVDLNGDGWLDILGVNYQTASDQYVYIHNPGRAGSVWVRDLDYAYSPPGQLLLRGAVANISTLHPAGYGISDFNGDGITDFIASEREWSDWRDDQHSYLSATGGDRTDLLRSYDNGRGVVVELEYASLIQQRDVDREAAALDHATHAMEDESSANDGLAEPPGPDPVWPSVDDVVHWPNKSVLATRTVSGPGVEPATTTFSYGHPRRDLESRADLGFRVVEVVRPDLTRTVTHFFQKHGRVGVPASQVILDDDGSPLRAEYTSWELPDPTTVTGGWAGSTGASVLDAAHIGRPARSTVANQYGLHVGDMPGSTTRTEWDYDDEHGYNFVSEVRKDVPGRAIRTVNLPAAKDFALNLMRRVARTTVYRDEGADTALLSDTQLDYTDQAGRDTRSKVGLTRRLQRPREGAGTSRWLWTFHRFDANGNLLETRRQANESASGPGRSTFYCYDGDPGCAAGHGSRSMVVGTRDALGSWTRTTPHPVFAVAASTESDYVDEPNTRTEFDAQGRPTHRWWVPRDGGADVLLSRMQYVDFADEGVAYGVDSDGETFFLPYAATTEYAEPGGLEGVSSIEVADGFGGTFLAVNVLDSMASAASVRSAGVQITADPRSARIERTEPFACGAATPGSPVDFGAILERCDEVPESSKTSTVWTRDGLGRTIRIDTPLDGLLVSDYGAETISLDGHSPAEPVDRILRKNALGGFREERVVGGLPVYIAECNDAPLQPDLADFADLAGQPCVDPDITRLSYDGTGDLLERTDPTAIAGAGSGPHRFGAESNQKLRYRYDTLGRIVEIDDPDGGVSHLTYNAYGEPETTLDARAMQVTTTYDALGRPEQISSTDGTPTTFRYESDLLRVAETIDGDLAKKHFYDELGRTRIEIRRAVGAPPLLSHYRHDLMGRATRISYPVALDGIVETVGYDYAGALLEAVCSLGVDIAEDCTSAWATGIVTDFEYDGIGRVTAMHLPGGVRRFTYDGNSGRRTSDRFDSQFGAGEDIDFVYEMDAPGVAGGVPAYDRAGNLLRVAASLGSGVGSRSYQMEYRYDARGRLALWKFDENGDGAFDEYPFGYDSRGNLTNHAGVTQDYESDHTAHAIRARRVGDVATHLYTYDAAGNLASRIGAGPDDFYTFDARGRLSCVGSIVAGCDRLSVRYGGDGERREESGARRYRYAGNDFRLRPASGGSREYWIEVFALGQRVAYKHVAGGAIRIMGLSPGWRVPPAARRSFELLLCGLALWGLARTSKLLAGSPRPVRVAVAMAVSVGVGLLPLRIWAIGAPANPIVGGMVSYRWVMADAIGSSLIEIDAAGRRLSHVAYAPFGEEALSSGDSGVDGRRYFAGHDRQIDVGLVYMNARWMAPRIGRFLSVDPLVPDLFDPQTFNGYSYAGNNPISSNDPTGEFALAVAAAVVIAAYVAPIVIARNVNGGKDAAATQEAVGIGVSIAAASVAAGLATGPAVTAGVTDVAVQSISGGGVESVDLVQTAQVMAGAGLGSKVAGALAAGEGTTAAGSIAADAVGGAVGAGTASGLDSFTHSDSVGDALGSTVGDALAGAATAAPVGAVERAATDRVGPAAGTIAGVSTDVAVGVGSSTGTPSESSSSQSGTSGGAAVPATQAIDDAL